MYIDFASVFHGLGTPFEVIYITYNGCTFVYIIIAKYVGLNTCVKNDYKWH